MQANIRGSFGLPLFLKNGVAESLCMGSLVPFSKLSLMTIAAENRILIILVAVNRIYDCYVSEKRSPCK